MLNFCTLFNSAYLAKGIALYDSLLKNCDEFHLYIFAFDEITCKVLSEKKFSNATVIPQHEFETEQLLAAKSDRSVAEYCWTCTPFTIKYSIEKFKLDHCTYLDADTFFYRDPAILIHEMGDNSVLITPHNYNSRYDQSAVSGIYCVQFITFKNNAAGMKILNWWAEACIKWCYARYEDGKMGDQKYLDSWPYMFDGVYICLNAGAGLAPWNLLNYAIEQNHDHITVNGEPLIFYHFHDLKYLSDNTWYIGGYEVGSDIIKNIYKPYISALVEIDRGIKAEYKEINTSNSVDAADEGAASLKFKLGAYWLDLKRSFTQFAKDLVFFDRRKHNKNNYIRVK